MIDLEEFRRDNKISQAELAKYLGVSQAFISQVEQGKRPLPLEHISKIKADTEWIVKEKKSDANAENNAVTLPLLPYGVMAGLPSDDIDGIKLEDCEQYTVPVFSARGAKFLARVDGYSMYPRFNSGDLLACRMVEDPQFIQWGRIYVMDTTQGPLVKRLFPSSEGDDKIRCHSENFEKFPDFEIPKTEVRRMAIVVGYIGIE